MWLIGNFNAHVGSELQSQAVGSEAQHELQRLEQHHWHDLHAKWKTTSQHLYLVAQKHFGMDKHQHNPKLLLSTFKLLASRRELMSIFLTEVDTLAEIPLRDKQQWQMRVVFRSIQLHSVMANARNRLNQDVRDWQNHLVERLAEADR